MKTTANQKKKSGNKGPASLKPDYSTHIVVRFREYVDLPYSKGVEKQIEDFRIGPWNKLAKDHPGVTIEPLFGNIDPEKLKALIARAERMDPTYKAGDFFKYFVVKCPVESDPVKVMGELSGWVNLKSAYLKSKHSAPGLVNYDDTLAVTSLTEPYQEYLDLAPVGISAKKVWDDNLAGSDGEGINLIDIETGWKLDHTDLPAGITISGTNQDSGKIHGTSVLGIISAVDNTDLCVGIAPEAGVDVISYGTTLSPVSPAIIESLTKLTFGDVLLIETTHDDIFQTNACTMPVETDDDDFDAIRLASALGIIVIEPGGSGEASGTSVDFDSYTKSIAGTDTLILNPDDSNFRDSGAIIVTASLKEVSPVNTHDKLATAPYGKRIDCYAQGEAVVTLSTDGTYTANTSRTDFDGTSAAAAIIAGAVLSMQGMAAGRPGGYKLSPGQVRSILRNPVYGTNMATFVPFPLPGSYTYFDIFMPDLNKFAGLCMNLYPDLYMRDFDGDTGEPHAGSISCSPDIILKNVKLTPPQTPQEAFGDPLVPVTNDIAKIGKANYLYARVKNRGGAAATGATVNIYFGVPSTLITPNLLTSVGPALTFPGDIPLGVDLLTVSNEYEWTPPSGSTAGHYCFVGIVSSPQDPALLLDNKLDELKAMTWDQYCQYIRANNNVTWRNFDMIVPPSPSPSPVLPPSLPKKAWRIIDFISPGLPGMNKTMHLEVMASLPDGGEAVIQVPAAMKNALPREIMHRIPPFWKKEREIGVPLILEMPAKKAFLFPLNPNGITLLNEMVFQSDSINKLKLFVFVPEKFERQQFSIAVRQMLDGEEIGRVSWALRPLLKKAVIPRPPVRKKGGIH